MASLVDYEKVFNNVGREILWKLTTHFVILKLVKAAYHETNC